MFFGLYKKYIIISASHRDICKISILHEQTSNVIDYISTSTNRDYVVAAMSKRMYFTAISSC